MRWGLARLRDGFPSWDGAERERPTLPVVSPASSRPMRYDVDPETGARLGRRGGFVGWRKIVDHLRDGDYEIMHAVCDDWFVALDDIGAERSSDFSVSKLDQIIDARLGKWTVITCNFTREQIAEHMDVRIASRLGRGKNVIVDDINVLDYSTRSHEEVA